MKRIIGSLAFSFSRILLNTVMGSAEGPTVTSPRPLENSTPHQPHPKTESFQTLKERTQIRSIFTGDNGYDSVDLIQLIDQLL